MRSRLSGSPTRRAARRTLPRGSWPPRLGGSHHYRVVDIKFTGLHLAASGELGNGGSGLAYKAQLFLYNRALGSAQGLLPPAAFVLGRSWEQREDGGRGFFERLAPLFQTGTVTRKVELMREIERYNEVDCRVMAEVIGYLREHH